VTVAIRFHTIDGMELRGATLLEVNEFTTPIGTVVGNEGRTVGQLSGCLHVLGTGAVGVVSLLLAKLSTTTEAEPVTLLEDVLVGELEPVLEAEAVFDAEPVEDDDDEGR